MLKRIGTRSKEQRLKIIASSKDVPLPKDKRRGRKVQRKVRKGMGKAADLN
jgi:hypothetical protein